MAHNICVTFSTFQLRKYVHGPPLVQGKTQKFKLFPCNLVATSGALRGDVTAVTACVRINSLCGPVSRPGQHNFNESINNHKMHVEIV